MSRNQISEAGYFMIEGDLCKDLEPKTYYRRETERMLLCLPSFKYQ